MGGVTTTVMDVVHVVAVRDGDMPTPLGMHMVMPLMNAVLADLTFVVVAIVDFVQVSIVDIVDMVAVRDGDMPTRLTMGVVMANVLFVRRCHLESFLSQSSGEPVQLATSSHIRSCVYIYPLDIPGRGHRYPERAKHARKPHVKLDPYTLRRGHDTFAHATVIPAVRHRNQLV
jgi:hypothetical protein